MSNSLIMSGMAGKSIVSTYITIMEIELSIKRSFQGDKRAFSISKIHASHETSLQAILANLVSPHICNNHFLAWSMVLDTFVPPINNSNLLQTQSRSQQIPKPWYPSLYSGFQIIQQVTNTTVSYIFLSFSKLPTIYQDIFSPPSASSVRPIITIATQDSF